MMLVHELGHILGAAITGGRVTRLVWHPLVFSRTDISPNPHPLIVVWSGPLVGVLLPLLIERIVAWRGADAAYMFKLFTGFCLIANGAYLGIGFFDAAGDAGDMIRLGTPAWLMMTFGVSAALLGLWLWHLASFRLGLGREHRASVPASHAWGSLGVGLLVNALAFALGYPRA
jgi:hypothetical protein